MSDKAATTCLFLGMFTAALGIFFSSSTLVVAALVLTTLGWFGIAEGIFVVTFTALIYKSSQILYEILSTPDIGIFTINVAIAVLALIAAFTLPMLFVRLSEIETLK